jgi:hypothetical protein
MPDVIINGIASMTWAHLTSTCPDWAQVCPLPLDTFAVSLASSGREVKRKLFLTATLVTPDVHLWYLEDPLVTMKGDTGLVW